MKVQDTMTSDVFISETGQPIREVAQMMAKLDCGILPVGEDDRLVGMITDRDLAVRAVADGMSPDTPVEEVMSSEVCYCYADQDLAEVCANMAEQKIRRLPVLNRDKRLVGIISIGDIACTDGKTKESANALSGISEPGGTHSQVA